MPKALVPLDKVDDAINALCDKSKKQQIVIIELKNKIISLEGQLMAAHREIERLNRKNGNESS